MSTLIRWPRLHITTQIGKRQIKQALKAGAQQGLRGVGSEAELGASVVAHHTALNIQRQQVFGLHVQKPIAITDVPNVLGMTPVTHRGIVSAITPIGIPQANSRSLDPALIRRLANDVFRVYQLDATAYPGNSGSPLYDPASGEVVGVMNMVFVKSTKENVLSDPSGISYAIPVEYLQRLLADLK